MFYYSESYDEYQQKLGSTWAQLVLYPWSRSQSVRWCLDEGYRHGEQHCPIGDVAWERTLPFLLIKKKQKKTYTKKLIRGLTVRVYAGVWMKATDMENSTVL